VYRRRSVYFTKIIQRRPNFIINIVKNKSLFKKILEVVKRSDTRSKNILKNIPDYNIRN